MVVYMKFERSKLIMFNHRPDDREFLYFLKFHPIYHYNVHESDLEVSGVQFGLKRFIRQSIGVTNIHCALLENARISYLAQTLFQSWSAYHMLIVIFVSVVYTRNDFHILVLAFCEPIHIIIHIIRTI